jgi:predicted N-formylglutamate amidohydrolase
MVKGAAKHAFVISCEHGGNRVPVPYRPLFHEADALLNSHQGYDPGALVMARAMAAAFKGPLVISTVSRLLIDLNRSIGHPQLFSAATWAITVAERKEIIAHYYAPYRAQVGQLVSQSVADGRRVLHISSHSFTPVLDGKVRQADVGLLYNPARRGEAELCARWRESLAVLAPELRVRRNYPYLGKGDGMTSYLRRHFPVGNYLGIELEINQEIVFAGGSKWKALRAVLIASLRTASEGSLP